METPCTCGDAATRIACRDCKAPECGECAPDDWSPCVLCNTWSCGNCSGGNTCRVCERECCHDCLIDFAYETNDVALVLNFVCVVCVQLMLREKDVALAARQRQQQRRNK